jgi:hypothetical protein
MDAPPDPRAGLGGASPDMSSLGGLAQPSSGAAATPQLAPQHRTLNTVLKMVALGLAGSAAGMGEKRPGEAAAAGARTGIGLVQQGKENARADQATANQTAEAKSRIKFQNAQSAEATARAAMYDQQLHQMPQEFQDTHNARTAAFMKDMQDMGITPTIMADNHGTGANAALEQLTDSHGGVPHMFIMNLGDKLVGYDLGQLTDNAGIRDQVNKVAEIQGKGTNAYSPSRWGLIGKEGREQITQQALGFFMPMATKDNADSLLQQYKNYQQTYAQNPNADPKFKAKLDDTVKMLQQSRDNYVKQKAQEAAQVAQAEVPVKVGLMKAEVGAKIEGDAAAREKDERETAHFLQDPNNLSALKDVSSMRTGERMRVFKYAKEENPAFDTGVLANKVKFLGEFTDPNGKTATGIDAANTFFQHGASLLDLTKAYRTTNIKLLNTPLNKIADAFGSDKYTDYSTALGVVRSEYTNAIKAGFAPQVDDSKEGREIMSESSTPAQVEAAVKRMGHNILARVDSKGESYKTNMGSAYPNLITPAGAEAANKIGLDVSKYSSGGQIGKSGSGQPAGATHEVYAADGKTLIGHVVNGSYVPLTPLAK